jgi:hypothetical protein
VLSAFITEPLACGELACWAGEAPAPDEGRAAAVIAKPANSRRLRRVTYRGSAAVESWQLDFMEFA